MTESPTAVTLPATNPGPGGGNVVVVVVEVVLVVLDVVETEVELPDADCPPPFPALLPPTARLTRGATAAATRMSPAPAANRFLNLFLRCAASRATRTSLSRQARIDPAPQYLGVEAATTLVLACVPAEESWARRLPLLGGIAADGGVAQLVERRLCKP